jgi:NAD(P)H dehydrogenase (quinone)
MKTLLVPAHPESKSFNAAMFEQAVTTLALAKKQVVTSDLYAMKFDPVSSRRNFTQTFNANYLSLQAEEERASKVGGFCADIEAEIRKIESSELMILHFPLWWFSMPGILKGWVDRVFAFGRTYGYARTYGKGQFRGKRAMLTLTTGGPESIYVPGGFNGDINAILAPIERGIVQFLGLMFCLHRLLFCLRR